MKIVEVTWIDAQSSMDVISVSDLEKEELLITKSCGYLVKEDKDKIILGFMLFGSNALDEPLLKHYQIIPRAMVKKIKLIGGSNEKRRESRRRYEEKVRKPARKKARKEKKDNKHY